MDCGGLLQEDWPGGMPRAFGRCSSLRRSPQDSQPAPCPIHHPRAAEAGRALPLHGGRGQGRLRPRAPPAAAHPHHPRPWCSSRLPPWLRGHCRRERSCGKRTGAFRCQPLGFAFPGRPSLFNCVECVSVDENESLLHAHWSGCQPRSQASLPAFKTAQDHPRHECCRDLHHSAGRGLCR